MSREETHDVDEDGGEDGARDGFAVGRVVGAAHELLVVGAVEEGEDAEDDDCEEGDDGAAGNHEAIVSLNFLLIKSLAVLGCCFARGMPKSVLTYHDQACIELTTGFMMGELGACEFKHAKSEDGRYDSVIRLRKEGKKKRRRAKGKKKNKRASCKAP